MSEESKDASTYISKQLQNENIPFSLHRRIKDFFTDNKPIGDNLTRQKAYIGSLRTYIDVVTDKTHKNVYFLNLYILPKDINLSYDQSEDAKTIIQKIDKLSFHLFRLYDSLENNKNTKLQALKLFKGNTFLDLELAFYLQELHRLYDYLLNYKRSMKDKIVCSDKDVGIMIDALNELEDNPLKQYQFVKVPHQNDLIVFVYSLLAFLEIERINYFKTHPSYKNLKNILAKLNNYLLKISTSSHIKKESIIFATLQKFFNRYKNSKEMQKNTTIYNILESIFYNQLREGVFISRSIDMTKMFEKVVENILKDAYGDSVFVGKEPDEMDGIEPYRSELNKINHLLVDQDDNKPLVGQFPDFLVRDDSGIYHIVDAKYKLQESLIKDRTMFWQVLIYSKLFNKDVNDNNKIKKVIVFAETSSIDLDNIDNIVINNAESIDIFTCDYQYNETIFDSHIGFIGIKSLTNRS